ncbi:TPA: hypothetical protein ACV4T7_005729, partial [Burkholderia ambifaria]
GGGFCIGAAETRWIQLNVLAYSSLSPIKPAISAGAAKPPSRLHLHPYRRTGRSKPLNRRYPPSPASAFLQNRREIHTN